MPTYYYKSDIDLCICCGAVVSEGECLCVNCKQGLPKCSVCGKVLQTNEKNICDKCIKLYDIKVKEDFIKTIKKDEKL